MKQPKTTPASSRQGDYARLCAQLANPGWISDGSVQDRRATGGSPSFAWTRKVKGKTVCVALSMEQYEWMKQAIANWRAVQKTLRQMQRFSREELFKSLPNPRRRKRLGKSTLGLR
jgi:hypothetical protein